MIHHGDTETRRKLLLEDLTQEIIGAAIDVHRELGPGLLESACEECLCHELHLRGLIFERQVPLPVLYKGLKLDCGYRLDIVAENAVILELKSVEKVLPVHEAQLLTYLKLTGKRGGSSSTSMFPFSGTESCEKYFDGTRGSPCLRVSVVRNG